ncbi:MAG: YceI family protein [Acidobacteria bacterium]|nr:MAG: YceI family protein [Acidobacteriota bacterium]
MNKLLIGILSATLFLAACEDPAANKPKATTTNTNVMPANTNNANAAPKQGELLAINNENSKVSFVGSKVTGKHDGGFNKFSGNINLVNGKAEDSSVSVDIDIASIYTNEADLTKHLQTADFFDAEKFPKATFSSTTIVPDADKGAGNYTVTGDFELHGVKKSISFPATITVTDSEVTVDSEFSINRKDFGILYAGKADDLIRDLVAIKLDLKASRKK